MEELERLCDRVLVMFRGKIVNEFTHEQIYGEAILKACMSGGIEQ
jgi:ABC-type sugar transport system ATPase subunit